MTDLSHTIIPKSDQLNYDDLIAGPRTITVTKVDVGKKGSEQPVSIHFEGDDGKPYKPGLSMRRVLFQVWGGESQNYVGKSMTLFGDPTVKWAGKAVGGIRISHMSHIDRPRSLMLTTTRGQKSEYTVLPLAVAEEPEVLKEARRAADQGGQAFAEWWKRPERKEHDTVLLPHKDDLVERAKKADAAKQTLSEQLSEGQPVAEQPEEQPAADQIDPNHPAYQEGHAAFSEGVTECPYDEGPEQTNWLAGWEDAKKEAE